MHERPLADPSRAEFAASLYAEGLSPEEYAARYAHTIGCSSLGDLRYEDPALDAWIQHLHDILGRRNGAPTVEELRARLLTPEERARIAEESEEF